MIALYVVSGGQTEYYGKLTRKEITETAEHLIDERPYDIDRQAGGIVITIY